MTEEEFIAVLDNDMRRRCFDPKPASHVLRLWTWDKPEAPEQHGIRVSVYFKENMAVWNIFTVIDLHQTNVASGTNLIGEGTIVKITDALRGV